MPGLKRPVRLIHLSDLHASDVVPDSLIEDAIEMAVVAKPDAIAVTGDFITTADGFDRRFLVKQLTRLGNTAPTFAVLGNHDGGRWASTRGGFLTAEYLAAVLAEAGIDLLHNRSARLPGSGLQLAGVGDLWSDGVNASAAFANADPALPTIALAHNPDTKDLLAASQWHLMLSGHTHGGQVVMPITGLSPAPVQDRRYIAGLKDWNDRWIHVSRGVGNARGFRFNCRPEVTLLELSGSSDPGSRRTALPPLT